MDRFIFIGILVSALGSGLVAGIFFAFSNFVMLALGRIPSNKGGEAMQSINVTVLNGLFLGVFFGTAIVCVVLAIASLLHWSTGSAWILAGALLYLVGTIAITMFFNVPLNNSLATADLETPAGQKTWSDYRTNWTLWNHVRTLASLAASACLIISLTYIR